MAASAADSSREARLQVSRAQFLSSLSSRLGALNEALTAVSVGTHVPGQQGILLRRLRAMGDAALMLDYEEMGHAFAAAAEVLRSSAEGGVSIRSANEVRSLLELVPSLIPDASDSADTGSGLTLEDLKQVGPLTLACVISAGQQVLLRRVLRGADNIRLVGATTQQELTSVVGFHQPDWIVVDGRRADAAELVARFRAHACLVIEAAGHAAARLRSAGAKIVATEGTPLRRALADAFKAPSARPSEVVPKADGATIARVVETITQDLRESLLVGLTPHETQQLLTPSTQSALEALTWSALSKMRELISEASGGAIQYPERAPEGALLVTGKSALRHSRHPSADSSNLKGRRVLVADDDPAIAWFLGSVLRASGAEVLEARDGLEALRIARRELPDLVISDVMMPELDGFALCRNLKRDVLLSDVPVILLSWKEDLLQRVRELGVGAAGYLPKETEATIIIERCCEVLEPRVRIERRLRERETVHGRLDGVTPRLVLELASRTLDNARVTFRDAAFNYEVWVGDGRILAALRSGKDVPEERGTMVLSGLLGMRAGRFVVEPTQQAVQAEIFGSLNKVLAPHVERARRALAQLQGTRVYDVQRLDLDYAGIAPYLASSPTIMAKLVERLVQGAAPSALLQQVSAGLLESVLVDLALRGAVLGAWDADGNDLLSSTAEPAEAFDVDLGPPKPGTVLRPAPGAPKVNAQSTASDVQRAAEFAEQALAASSPPPRVSEIPDMNDDSAVRPAVSFHADTSLESPALEAPGNPLPEASAYRPIDCTPSDEDVATPAFTRASEMPLAASADEMLAAYNDIVAPVEEAHLAPAEVTTKSEAHHVLPENLPDSAVNASPPPATPADKMDAVRLRDSEAPDATRIAEGFELFQAVLDAESPAPSSVLSLLRREYRPPRAEVEAPAPAEANLVARAVPLTEPVRSLNSGLLVARNLQQRPTLTGLGFPSPPRKLDWREFIGEQRADEAWALSQFGADQEPSPADALDLLFADGGESTRVVAPPTENPSSSAVARPAPQPEPNEVPAKGEHAPTLDDAPLSVNRTASVAASSAQSESAEPSITIDVASESAIPVFGTSFEHAALSRPGAEVAASSASTQARSAEAELEDINTTQKSVRIERQSPPTKPLSAAPDVQVVELPEIDVNAHGPIPLTSVVAKSRPFAVRVLLPAAIVLGTGAAVFGVSSVVWSLLGAPPAERSAATAGAMPVVEQAAAALEPAAKQQPQVGLKGDDDDLTTEDNAALPARVVALQSSVLELPDNLQLGPDNGLLEVNTDGRHKIYVNDVFVGRGPVRRVPLKPGPYSIALRLDGSEQVYQVDILLAKRTRLEPSAPAAP